MVLSKNQSWEQKYAIFAWISLLSSYPGNNQHLLQKDNRKSRISRHTAYCTKLCCSHACALPCFLMILTCGLNFQDWPQTCLIIMTCLATWPLLVLPDLLCPPLWLRPWSSSCLPLPLRSSCPSCSLALNSWCLSALLSVGKYFISKVSSFHRHS